MNTSSLGFPKMFDVARNKINTYVDRPSIASRVRLMLLTDPTELYMNPSYGVGLKKYMFQYNQDNIVAQIRDKLVEQLKLWEPSVVADKTDVVRGLLYSGRDSIASVADDNQLKLTITVYSIYGETINIQVSGTDTVSVEFVR